MSRALRASIVSACLASFHQPLALKSSTLTDSLCGKRTHKKARPLKAPLPGNVAANCALLITGSAQTETLDLAAAAHRPLCLFHPPLLRARSSLLPWITCRPRILRFAAINFRFLPRSHRLIASSMTFTLYRRLPSLISRLRPLLWTFMAAPSPILPLLQIYSGMPAVPLLPLLRGAPLHSVISGD